jgi:NodT family efflux transporter outer membrane factor (OMF) lipoprotein
LESWETDLYGSFGAPVAQEDVDLEYWWHLFKDPKLNELIELARAENPSLRIAGLRILESRATLGIADSLRYPQVQQASGAAAYNNTQQTDTDEEQSFSSYNTGLAVGWEMDFWGKFQRGIESADAAFFTSIANQRDAQVLLSAQVADAYFAYRTSVLRIKIANSNADIQKRSYDITEKLFKSGQQSELDLQQAKTQYLATLSTIPDLELTLYQVRNALCALLGRPPGELPELANLPEELPTLTETKVKAIPAQILLRRPDVRSAAWQVAAQSPQIGAAEADLYPSISLFGSIGFAGNTLDNTEDTVSLGVGPSFTWNIFDYGRIKNNVRVQDARLQIAIEAFQNVLLGAAREMDDAALSVIKTREKQVPLGQSLISARRSLELANRNYKEGYADFQRVLDAQRSVASQSEQELINTGKQISAVVDFYRAIGGGWLPDSVEEMLPEATREGMEARSDWGDLIQAPLPAAQLPNGEDVIHE